MDFKPNSSVLARALRPDRIRETTRHGVISLDILILSNDICQ